MKIYSFKYRGRLAILLCFCLIFSGNFMKETVIAATKGVCIVSKCMIRTGPSTNYSTVKVKGADAYLVNNQVVEIISTEDGWYKIKATFNGTEVEGYSLASYIKIANNANETVTNKKGICTANTLMIRTGPATTYSKVTVGGAECYLTNGQSVEILGSENGWYKIKATFSGTTIEGYSSGEFITVVGDGTTITPTKAPTATPSSTKSPTATPTPSNTKAPTATPKPTEGASTTYSLKLSATVTATNLNLRETAGTSGKLLATLKNGNAVTVIGETKVGSENWYKVTAKVDSKTLTGYVLSNHVKITVGSGFYANVLVNDLSPVTTAGGSTTVKLPNNTVWKVNKGRTWISDEVIVGGQKWFRIGESINGETIRGYVLADNIELLGKKVATPTIAPTATPKPETSKIDDEEDFQIPATVTSSKLNIRSKATTSSDILAALANGDKVTILNEVDTGTETWYRIATTVNKKTVIGYVYSSYVKLTLTNPLEAVAASKTRVRSTTSTTGTYVKDEKGNIIYLEKGTILSIKDEIAAQSLKWFHVKFSIDSKSYSGYLTSDQVNFLIPTSTPTPKPTSTPTEEPTSTPTIEPTSTPTPTKAPEPTLTTNKGTIINATALVIRDEAGYSGTIVSDERGQAVLLRTDHELTLLDIQKSDGIIWYKSSFVYGNETYTGYINEKYVRLEAPDNTEQPTATPTPINSNFEALLTAQGFPESYKPYLRELHTKYPNWEFVAYHTNLDWDTVIKNESTVGNNLITNSKSIEWKSLEEGAYNWKTDSFIVFDGSTWVTASKEAIAYYMDPRNFLTPEYVFQFETLSYQPERQNLAGVEKILQLTAMYQTNYKYVDQNGVSKILSYGETFMKAAEYSRVSPYHLASRVKQEVVTGTTTLSNSVSGTVSGFEGLYNFYNIGAYNSTVAGGNIANGLKYAKNGSTNAELNQNMLIPWTSPYNSIVGGAYYIGYNYINRGQDTIYLQKFNVTKTSTYAHQYMSNVEAPYAEGKKVFTAYSDDVDTIPIVFSIPVYLNMPSKAVPTPTPAKNPNNWLTSLKVLDISGKNLVLTPTYDITKDQEYYLVVNNNIDIINISAQAVSKKATVNGNDYYNLSVGNNQIIVYVIAENGTIREYKINIVRES